MTPRRRACPGRGRLGEALAAVSYLALCAGAPLTAVIRIPGPNFSFRYYGLTTVTTTYAKAAALLQGQQWWGDEQQAADIANFTMDALGTFAFQGKTTGPLFATNTSGTTGLLARALDVPGNVSLGATLSRSTSATFAVLAAVAVGLGRTEYEANINAFTNNVLVTLDATRTRGTEIPFQEFNFTVDCTAIGSGRRSVVGTQNTAFVNFAVANVTSGSTFGVAASGICTGLVTVRGANGTVDSRPFTIRVKVPWPVPTLTPPVLQPLKVGDTIYLDAAAAVNNSACTSPRNCSYSITVSCNLISGGSGSSLNDGPNLTFAALYVLGDDLKGAGAASFVGCDGVGAECTATLTAVNLNGEAGSAVVAFTVVVPPTNITLPTRPIVSGSPLVIDAAAADSAGMCKSCPAACVYDIAAECFSADGSVIARRSTKQRALEISTGAGAQIDMAGRTQPVNCTVTASARDLNAASSAQTQTIQVVPAPPTCTNVVSPKTVQAAVSSIACNAVKNVRLNTRNSRTGAIDNLVHVTLTAAPDPQGFPTTVRVTAVKTDRAPAACACSSSATGGCSCVPQVVAQYGSGAASALLLMLPQAPSSARGTGAPRGRVYRISYSLNVTQTGLSCEGVADVCFVAGDVRRNSTSCSPYNEAAPQFDALTCS